MTKGDLLAYYADVSDLLLPHLLNRAMVMKRYPDGAAGKFFFQKRAPEPRPEWIDICSIEHASGSVIGFPIVRDLSSLLWVINLGCIDLNPWYARCDDVNRPDYLHFDLDPVPGAEMEQVCETALVGTGSPHRSQDGQLPQNHRIARYSRLRPHRSRATQKQVWAFAKELAQSLAQLHPRSLRQSIASPNGPRGGCWLTTTRMRGVEL